MSDENLLRDELVDHLTSVVVPLLSSQRLMDLVGAVYKASFAKGTLQAILQTIVPYIERLMTPEIMGRLLEQLDLPENDKIMEDVLKIATLALNNLAPSEGLV
ncbi:MAG: hypothetical protein MASP_01953 [Candidatus Methanolliviera sp. GoM_asphalt]|nr:MAG: hypothetical protein MASP_01953 [Candidatus Methanolliviera sp. GoM_asphalt]